MLNDDEDLDALSKPTLTRRKDFIDKEEEARKSPNRVLYFRRNADFDRLIEVCTRKIADNPRNLRALLIRASSLYKKGEAAAQGPWQQALAVTGGATNPVQQAVQHNVPRCCCCRAGTPHECHT
jgi:hypothetical protein